MDHLEFLRSLRDREDRDDSVTESHRRKIIDACIDIETPYAQPGLRTKGLRRLKNLQKSKERVSDKILEHYLTPVNYDAYQLLHSQGKTKNSSSRRRQRENRKLTRQDAKGASKNSRGNSKKPKVISQISQSQTMRYLDDLFENDIRPADLALSNPYASSVSTLILDFNSDCDSEYSNLSGLVWEAEYMARAIDCMPFGSLEEMESFKENQKHRRQIFRQHLKNAESPRDRFLLNSLRYCMHQRMAEEGTCQYPRSMIATTLAYTFSERLTKSSQILAMLICGLRVQDQSSTGTPFVSKWSLASASSSIVSLNGSNNSAQCRRNTVATVPPSVSS